LYEVERAWYFNVAGAMGATLSLPKRTPNSNTTLGFCTLYVIAGTVLGYMINDSCIKGINVSLLCP